MHSQSEQGKTKTLFCRRGFDPYPFFSDEHEFSFNPGFELDFLQ